MLRKIVELLDLVKFQHTLFALPFAVMSAFLAANGLPPPRTLLLILLAMVTARSCAMAFNRIADAGYDARNPRTADRAIPAGRLGMGTAWAFTIVAGLLFVGTAWAINPLCFYLSPAALAVILGYSFTKRFTNLSHLVLGLALAIAPVGAWIAVTGAFALPPILLAAAVVCWVAGFDIIYACQDVDFDGQAGLYSLPRTLGIRWALRVSTGLHAVMILLLLGLVLCGRLGWLYVAGVAGTALMLGYEHRIVKPDDLSRANTAFFTVNGVVSILLAAAAIADVMAG